MSKSIKFQNRTHNWSLVRLSQPLVDWSYARSLRESDLVCVVRIFFFSKFILIHSLGPYAN